MSLTACHGGDVTHSGPGVQLLVPGSPLARLWWWSCGACRGGVWSPQRWRRCCWWVAGRWLRGCSRAPLTRYRARSNPLARGGGCCRPVGDDARTGGDRGLPCDHATGAEAGLVGGPSRPAIASGVAVVLVAVFPETAGGGGSLAHTFWSTVAFVALAVWPLAACRRGPVVPAWLRPGVCAVAAGVLLGLLVWFGAELIGAGRRLGLAERVLAGAEAVWPLMVVLACAGASIAPALPPAGKTCPDQPGRRA